MAGLRKGHCYTPIKRAYTRKSKYKKYSFIKAVPVNRIVRYHMGDVKKKFTYQLHLVSKQAIQIRHNSIEATRQVVNRRLTKLLNKDYYFNVRLYPHHVLRENKMLTGAGADRMQTGMQRAFGKAIGLAAQVKKNQEIFTIKVDKGSVDKAKVALKLSFPRLPGQFRIDVKEIK